MLEADKAGFLEGGWLGWQGVGHVFSELSSFFPTLDIAAGAFFPQTKAIPDFVGHVLIEKSMCFIVFSEY